MLLLLLLDCIARTMHADAVYCYRLSSVVCLSVTVVSPAKIAELIEMPFGLWSWVCPRNHALEEVWITRAHRQFLRKRTCWLTCHPSQQQMCSSTAGAVVALLPAGISAFAAGVTGAGEYDSTVCVQRRCGLLSNYCDHLFVHSCQRICQFKSMHVNFTDHVAYMHARAVALMAVF